MTFHTTVKNVLGLHNGPSARVVMAAMEFQDDITVWIKEKPERKANAKSILEVCCLAAGPGVTLVWSTEDSDAKAIADRMTRCIDQEIPQDECEVRLANALYYGGVRNPRTLGKIACTPDLKQWAAVQQGGAHHVAATLAEGICSPRLVGSFSFADEDLRVFKAVLLDYLRIP